MTTIASFINRLSKIGIEVKLIGNYPWVYFDTINGYKVKGKYAGNHGFTVFFKANRIEQKDSITSIPLIFLKIRETLEKIKEEKEGQKSIYNMPKNKLIDLSVAAYNCDFDEGSEFESFDDFLDDWLKKNELKPINKK